MKIIEVVSKNENVVYDSIKGIETEFGTMFKLDPDDPDGVGVINFDDEDIKIFELFNVSSIINSMIYSGERWRCCTNRRRHPYLSIEDLCSYEEHEDRFVFITRYGYNKIRVILLTKEEFIEKISEKRIFKIKFAGNEISMQYTIKDIVKNPLSVDMGCSEYEFGSMSNMHFLEMISNEFYNTK